MSKFLASHARFIDSGYFHGKLFKISWFPGAVLSESEDDRVYGAIFELESALEVFKFLDAYEGFNENNKLSSLFIRTQIKVFLKNGDAISAWVYLYNQKITNELQIISGDFLKDGHT